jgi:hypothetical protein
MFLDNLILKIKKNNILIYFLKKHFENNYYYIFKHHRIILQYIYYKVIRWNVWNSKRNCLNITKFNYHLNTYEYLNLA